MVKKPVFLSVFGVAASIAIVVSFLFPAPSGPTVQAAVIIEKLNEQIEENPVIEVTLDSLTIDEAFVDGLLQVSPQGIAGDLAVKVQEGGPDETVEVDLALAVSEDGGWVLIRKLTVPDPEAQAILDMIFPPGSEVLLMLPEGAAGEHLGLDLAEDLQDLKDIEDFAGLGSGTLVAVFKELIDTHAEYGVTVENQPDGTVLLTLPIEDEEALKALERLAIRSAEVAVEVGAKEPGSEIEVEIDDVDLSGERDLLGSTLMVVYDPARETVRSFGIKDLGDIHGSVMVTIREGEIDPGLFDSRRVTTPQTRTLDLGALEAIFGNVEMEIDLDG